MTYGGQGRGSSGTNYFHLVFLGLCIGLLEIFGIFSYLDDLSLTRVSEDVGVVEEDLAADSESEYSPML
jgi:hypothetical protein